MTTHTSIPHRPFTTAEARDLGISKRGLANLVALGVIRRVLRGVYAPRALGDSLELRAQAAMLVMPRNVVVVDRSAAWLYGIDVLDYEELDDDPVLEVVSIGPGHDRTQRSGTLGGKRALLPEDVTTIGGVRVTTPLRTACDIACLRGRHRALATLDAFRRAFGLSEQDLARMLPRYAKRRGVVQLRELIPLSTDQADSQAESWVRLIIHDAGLPMPAAQVWTLLVGWGRVKTENAYEHKRIAVEYDGEEHHTLDTDIVNDEARREALRKAGWIIIVIRRGDLATGARDRWLAELRQALEERTRARGRRVYARGPASSSYPRRRRTR